MLISPLTKCCRNLEDGVTNCQGVLGITWQRTSFVSDWEHVRESGPLHSGDRQPSSVEQWQAVQWDQAGCGWGSEGGKGASRESTRAWQLMVSHFLLCEGLVSGSGCLLVRQGKGEIMDLAKGQRQNLMHPNNSATPYIGFWLSLGKFYSWFLSSDFSSGFAFPIWLPQIWGLTKGFGY